jgi:hypothetical protein
VSQTIRLHLDLIFQARRRADWFEGQRRSGSLPGEAELYVLDALDRARHGTNGRDQVVRRVGDHPYGRVRDEVGR